MDPRVLHPFRPLLAGSVLVAGAANDSLLASLRDTARSVAVADDAAPQAARFDTVVLADPPAAAWMTQGEQGADRLTQVLAWACASLRPGGRLIVVVENALSLRHFAGHPETASAPGLFSLEDRARPDGFVLPTRRDLRDRLACLGLGEQAWWFPFPDHRLALSLLAEGGLVVGDDFDPSVLAAAAAAFDPDGPGEGRFSLPRAWAGVSRAGLVGDLAPAFAVAASAAALPPDPRLALHFGHRRRPAFDKVVGFVRETDAIRVTRTPLHPDLPRAVDGVVNRFPDEAFIPGAPWQVGLHALLARDGWTLAEIVAWAAVWRDAVRALYMDGGSLTPDTPLPGGAIDAIPRNLMHRNGCPVFIDAEWEIDALDFGHLLVRGLVNAFTDVPSCGAPGPGIVPTLLDLVHAVAEGLGTPLDPATLDAALAREDRFQTIVSAVKTRRDRAWLAAARLVLRTAPADPRADADQAADQAIARLHAEATALRAEGDRRVAAVTEDLEEARRRTDRVIRYAADLDRERGRLARDLAESRALLVRHRVAFGDTIRAKLAAGLGRFAPRRDGAKR